VPLERISRGHLRDVQPERVEGTRLLAFVKMSGLDGECGHGVPGLRRGNITNLRHLVSPINWPPADLARRVTFWQAV
jgi:hypothetical protein